jgi:hypothetical protein
LIELVDFYLDVSVSFLKLSIHARKITYEQVSLRNFIKNADGL